MDKIEQVFVFVSHKEKNYSNGIPTAQSSGLLPVDLTEIWEIAKRFCLPQGKKFDILNLFFHHLPSGRYAIGRLIPAPEEDMHHPQTGSFALQYMILSPDTFFHFGNNPVFVYQAILAHSSFSSAAKPGSPLTPIELKTPRKWFDIPLLRGMSSYPGSIPLAKLTDTVLHSLSTIVTGGQQTLYLISTLFNLFPIRFRPELTFSSGVFFMPDRHFRIIGITGKNSENSLYRDFCPIPYLNLDKLASRAETIEIRRGWGKWIKEVLESGNFDLFQARLMNYDCRYFQRLQKGIPLIPSAAQLDELGNRWLREKKSFSGIDPISLDQPQNESNSFLELPRKGEKKIFQLKRSEQPVEPSANIPEKLRRWLLDDKTKETPLFFRDTKPAHPRFLSPLVFSDGKNRIFSPFQRLLAVYPKEEEELRHLDHLVTSILNGDQETLDELIQFWNLFAEDSDEDHKWRISEEYIHLIQLFIGKSEMEDGIRIPCQGVIALDLLNVFLNKGESAEFSLDAD